MTVHQQQESSSSRTSGVRIAIVGSGYVGLVAAACFAEIGHSVICVDNNDEKVAALRSGHIPIHEALLPELLRNKSEDQLSFTSDLGDAVRRSQVIFIAVGTPPMGNGDADLSYVEAVAAEIARSIDGYKLIVEKSTVPVFTSGWIARILCRDGIDPEEFDVVSNPEFLREGMAVTDFLHPDRIVVGCDSERAYSLMQRIYAPLTEGTYYEQETSLPGSCSAEAPAILLRTSPNSAELIKHASNAFLAMKISFINSVANVCEAAEADIGEVATGIGLDSRIGHKFLSAGIGYGGSCFPKDVQAFRAVGAKVGVNLSLLNEVEQVNSNQLDRFMSKLRSNLWTLRSKRIAVLGLSFKGGTDDIRESPAIQIVLQLVQEGCRIVAFDPAAMDNARPLLPESSVTFASSPYEAAENADALVILTDWKEFAELDLALIRSLLRYPVLFDGRNMFDPAEVKASGLDYISVGRRPRQAFEHSSLSKVKGN